MSALCAPSGDAAAALIYDTFNAAGFLFDNAAAAAFCDAAGILAGPAVPTQQQLPAAAAPGETQAATSSAPGRVRKRRRRTRSCKSREEAESQRMTHIAVERNRRRQMNEYLAVLRSLMPESYVQRGDQASVVGGAIEFVKELEQQLQSLEARKRTLVHQHKAKSEAMPMLDTTTSSSNTAAAAAAATACTRTVEEGCGLTTTDDIAGAVHHLLCIIDAEATSQSQHQLLLAVG
ncbi:hypothetical protein ACP70R_027614 [Stipagrostis hirtigluma subsp. patula]